MGALLVWVGGDEAAQRAGVVALLGVVQAGGRAFVAVEAAEVVVSGRRLHLLAEGHEVGLAGALLRAPGASAAQPVGHDHLAAGLRQALAEVDVALAQPEDEVALRIPLQAVGRQILRPKIEGDALAAVGRLHPDAQVLVVVAVALRAVEGVHPDQPVLRIVAHAHHGKQHDVAIGVIAGLLAQHPVGLRIVPHLVRVAIARVYERASLTSERRLLGLRLTFLSQNFPAHRQLYSLLALQIATSQEPHM